MVKRLYVLIDWVLLKYIKKKGDIWEKITYIHNNHEI